MKQVSAFVLLTIVTLSLASSPSSAAHSLFWNQRSLVDKTDSIGIYNTLGLVEGNPGHNYSLQKLPFINQQVKAQDVVVSWPIFSSSKSHAFFENISKLATLSLKQLKLMNCEKLGGQQGIDAFRTICGYSKSTQSQVKKNFQIAFGDQQILSCSIPAHYFAINIRFVPNLRKLGGKIGGRWHIFGGIYRYINYQHARQVIIDYVKAISKAINQSNLDTFNINYSLNILPEFVSFSIADRYNDQNVGPALLKDTVPFKKYKITNEGFIKVVPPNTNLVIGGIHNGTSEVFQTCDDFRPNGQSLKDILY